jgi:hypothetical protein
MVSSTVGVLAPNCVVDYENSIFVLHENIVYQVQNWNFDPINIKVPFTYLNATPAAMAQPRGLSVLYDRLFVRYFDKTYVYHMKTRGWVEWTSSYTPAVFVKIPVKDPATGASEFVAVSCLNNVNNLFRFTDTIATGKGDEPAYTCRLITKTHAMEVPYTFKRLMWWGLDGFPKTDLTAKVSPVSYGRAVTWNQVATKKWNELGTWSRLLDISIDVTDSAEFGASSNTRSFIKFIRSLRFRQIYFTIETQVTGQPSDSPFRIYFIMAITANKQVVSAKVN